MTIIDRYISNNTTTPAAKLANALGVSETFVKCRRAILADTGPVPHPLTTNEEIHALIYLIDERKEGWAVDVARERIRRLDALAKI
jgi:hypothetical protein